MDNELNKLLHNEKLKNVDPNILKQAYTMSQKLKGKSSDEAMAMLMNMMATIKKSKSTLTRQEQKAIVEAIKPSLNPAQRKRIDMLMSLLN